MKQKHKRTTVFLLTVCLVLSLFPGTSFASGNGTGLAYSMTTPVYFLLKEEPAGRWLETYNWIHTINIGGVTHPAYCVESMKMSPEDGMLYRQVDASGMNYSETTMSGMREILRNGYPYTTKICGIDFGSDTVKAQAATQAAIRMWASYRKEQENASYNVFLFWNPEPRTGSALVKAGTAPGAADVYNAAIALFLLAKSGQTTTITAAFDLQTITLPESTGGDYFEISLTLSLTNCEYGTLSFSEAGAVITGVTRGTADRIENGATVKVRVPASAGGKTMTVLASGYSTKAVSSLQFYAEDTGHRQRLFVGRTDQYGVTVKEQHVSIPSPTPTPRTNPVSISKRALTTSSSGSAPGGSEGDAQELKGARLQILDRNRNVLFEWVTDGKEKQLNAVLVAGETYILHEVSAPPGYVLAKDQTFTVNSDGTINKVVMEDKPTRVEISKKSGLNGALLAGARMQIFDGNTLVHEWVTDGGTHTLVGQLTAGKTYRLHEVSAPAGYLIAADVTFTVGTTGEWDHVEMIDDYTKVIISKVSLVSGEELAGAELTLTDESGTEVASWVTDGTQTVVSAVLNPGETYTLTEVSAPQGYLTAETVCFRYGEDSPTVVMKDAPTVVVTAKKDRATDDYLPGAKMQILDTAGNVMEEWVSTDSDHRTVAKLAAGEKYILHEAEAPEGYSEGEDIEFTVSKDRRIDEIVCYNIRSAVLPATLPAPETGDRSANYVLYGIFGFLAAVNTGILGRRSRKRKQ
ncbi:MAG: Cys-Gln thioester bond-forming surface protein [Lachnospiraceae bacterium]|nr:Cys-Gln thioester bond-forming surface protein [Lachnospiraceae bacterium]